jgi:uncharacterized protein YjbI with pentapeptide repeats
MSRPAQLLWKLRSSDNEQALQAAEELQALGWLESGVLAGANLRYVHLQTAKLRRADLQKVDLSMADLRWADLSEADLQVAQLNKANLYRSVLSDAKLQGANLIRANLQMARGLNEEQLAQANMLWGATMPDGSPYDGRFNLPGDIALARVRRIDIDDAMALARFYGIAHGKPCAGEISSPPSWSTMTVPHLIRRLRDSDNRIVLRAVEELNARGRLSDGSLAWIHLRYAHLQGADLSAADLRQSDLSMVDLEGADLTHANLEGARLTRANLRAAELCATKLTGSTLAFANLQAACSTSDEQLARSGRLRGATLPDGCLYDGRFNLPGDITDARFLRVDLDNPQALADFYGVCLEDYWAGQQWAQSRMPSACLRRNVTRADAESILLRLFVRTTGAG